MRGRLAGGQAQGLTPVGGVKAAAEDKAARRLVRLDKAP
jgi:hypothetical protein